MRHIKRAAHKSSPFTNIVSYYFLTFTFLPQFFFLKIFLYFLTFDFFTFTVLTEDPLREFFTPDFVSFLVFLTYKVFRALSPKNAYGPIFLSDLDVSLKTLSLGHLSNALEPMELRFAPPVTETSSGHPANASSSIDVIFDPITRYFSFLSLLYWLVNRDILVTLYLA